MDYRLLKILELLKEHGYYSKPFVNWALKKTGKAGWKYFMMAARCSWKGDHKSRLLWIERGLRSRKISQTLKYILLAQKLSTLTALNSPETREIYNTLRIELANIPVKARDIVVPILLSHPYFSETPDLPDMRAWGTSYYDRKNATKIYYLRGCARKEVKAGNLKRAVELFKESLEIAFSLPHPTAIIGNLNDIAWYLKRRNSREALRYAREAAYWTGWYRENPIEVMHVFDTLFHVQLGAKDPEVVETANLILSITHSQTVDDRYDPLREACKRFQFDPEKSFYENTGELRWFLKRHIKSVNDLSKRSNIARSTIIAILKNKSKGVRGETLRKIIEVVEFTPSTAPNAIVNEWMKLQILDKFEKALDLFRKLSIREAARKFMATYMGMENRHVYSPGLIRYDKLSNLVYALKYDHRTIGELARGDYELMKFMVNMFFPHPYIKGRMDLAIRFFERFPHKKLMKFMSRYIELSEDHRTVVDQFVRDYIRYSIRWNVRIDPVEDLEGFIAEYKLNKQPAFLAYWVIENGKTRKKLVRTLHRFV